MSSRRNALLSGLTALVASSLITTSNAYRVNIRDTDELREVCSGMYGGDEAYIELTFERGSAGQLALVVYEWDDVAYLGAETGELGGSGDDGLPKTYICTTSAVRSGLCTKAGLGQFITTLPSGVSLEETSIFTTSLQFDANSFPVLEEPTWESDEDLPVLDELESSTIAEVAPGVGLPTSSNTAASSKPTSIVGVPVGLPGDYDDTEDQSESDGTSGEGTGEEMDEVDNGEETEEEIEEEIEEILEEIDNGAMEDTPQETNEDSEAASEEAIEEEIEEEIAQEEAQEEAAEEAAEELYEEVLEEEIAEELEEEIEAEEEAEAEGNVPQTDTDRRSIASKRSSGLAHIKSGFAAGQYAQRKRGWFGGSSSSSTSEENIEAEEEVEDELIDELIDAVDTGDYAEAEDLYEEIAEVDAEITEQEGGDPAAEPLPSLSEIENEYEQLEELEQSTSTSSAKSTRPTGPPKRPTGGPHSAITESPTTTAAAQDDYAEYLDEIAAQEASGASSGSDVPVYSAPIVYAVPKTGYYCIGVVPVTLVNSKRDGMSPAPRLEQRQSATHAEYGGSVLFRNEFEGELPAAEYPKIKFYLLLSFVYVLLAGGWGFLCAKYYRELLPMQYYISGTVAFLVIEMVANYGYYRYINKHGGGAGSFAFLMVVAILNAGRNSLSFFLLLIVSMGLSVVTPSLGAVMNRVRLLTILHFIFGVLYAIGTVEVELETASLFVVLFLIFPLALTLTAFLMWTIVSLNGTILHLAARKQRHKLQMFKTLWRILVIAVIAMAAFFVISSLSLSNRLEEDYAPRSWKYRWILLDGSLATIYLCTFASIAWLWRPNRDSIRFAMSQELAQDEAEADAEDYEMGEDLEGSRMRQDDYEEVEGVDESEGFIHKSNGLSEGGIALKDENVVFALDDDEDEENGGTQHAKSSYRDEDDDDSKHKFNKRD